MTHNKSVEIVEVGPRDGFQGIKPFIPTETKIDLMRRLAATGLKRIEIGSFVSAQALPQLADTPALLFASTDIGDLRPQVLVPNERYGAKAIEAGATFLAYVLSVSDAHNRNNVRRSPMESAQDYARLLEQLPSGADMRLNIATAFDCPFEGRISEDSTIALLDLLVPLNQSVEVCLCDTTGRASPDHVASLFSKAMIRFPAVQRWALHAHDTYGLGLANVYSAWLQGIRVFDASFAGLGGCPFAPGATGNVATEDVVWMFQRMGIDTGVSLDGLNTVAEEGARIPGGTSGGRVRVALLGS